MRAVVTRVSRAVVKINGVQTGRIDNGLLILLGISPDDIPQTARRFANKICNLRIFDDERGRMNLNLEQVGGSILVVSQFTLYADTSSNRPGFSGAAKSGIAQPLYELFIDVCRERGFHTEHGLFGAEMQVESVNEGPVTIFLDTQK